MTRQLEFRALLLKIQELLSDKDRQCLHFLMAEDIPRYLQVDSSFSGTLNLFQSLFDKSIIDHHDCEYLIEGFEKIHCYDAAQRLKRLLFFFFVQYPLYIFQSIKELRNKIVNQDYQYQTFFWTTMKMIKLFRIVRRNKRLQFVYIEKNLFLGRMNDIPDPMSIVYLTTSVTDVTCNTEETELLLSTNITKKKSIHLSRLINVMFTEKLNTRECILLITSILLFFILLSMTILQISKSSLA